MRSAWRRLAAGCLITILLLVPVIHIVLQPRVPAVQHPHTIATTVTKAPFLLSNIPPGLIKSYNYTLQPLTLPHFVDDRDEHIFKGAKVNLDMMKMFSKPGEVSGKVIIVKDVIISRNTTCDWNVTSYHRLDSLSQTQLKTIRTIPTACPIMVKHPNSVYAFLTEVLPRIVQLLPLLDQFKNTPIMLKWTTNPLILEILSSLRVPYIFHHSKPVRVTTILDTCQTPDYVSSIWHRGRHMLNIGISPKGAAQGSQIIVLTHSSPGHLVPRLLNSVSLLSYLRKRYSDSEVVEIDPGVLSLDTYKDAFSNVRLVIGTLSDSLSAIYFCHQGAKVLEVVPIHPKGGAVVAGSLAHAQTRHWLMSNMLQLSYWRIYETAHSASGDVTLSVSRLRRVLDRMDST